MKPASRCPEGRYIVAGVDAAEDCRPAVAWAAEEATRHRACLRLLSTRDNAPGPAHSPGATSQQAFVGAARLAGSHAATLFAGTAVLREEPIDALLDASRHAELVVLQAPARGEFTDLLLGCTALTLAGRAGCPVVTVPETHHDLGDGSRPVLLAVPDPGSTAAPAEFAFAEAEARGCPVTVLRVWQPSRAAAVAEVPEDRGRRSWEAAEAVAEAVRVGRRRHPRVAVRTVVHEGDGLATVFRLAVASALTVTGSRGAGPFGVRVGLIPHTLIHRAPCPVAVLPGTA